MAHRPFTRRQALQNQAWLEALRATGNPRLAARMLGVHRDGWRLKDWKKGQSQG